MGTSSSYNMKNAFCFLALTLALASAQTCDIKTGIACAKDIEPCIATCKTGLAACAKCLAGSWSGCQNHYPHSRHHRAWCNYQIHWWWCLEKGPHRGTYTMTMTGIGGVSLLSCQGDASVAATCPIGLGPIKVGTATYGAVKFPVKAGDAVSLPDIVSV